MLLLKSKLSISEMQLGLIQFYQSMLNESPALLSSIIYRRFGSEDPRMLGLPLAVYGGSTIRLLKGEDESSWFMMVSRGTGKSPAYIPMGIDFAITGDTLYHFKKEVLDIFSDVSTSFLLNDLIMETVSGIRRVFPTLHSKKKALFGIDESHSQVCVVSGEFDIYRFDVSIKNRVIGKSEWLIRVFEKKLDERVHASNTSLVAQWCTSSISDWLSINLSTHVTDLVTKSFKL